MREDIKERIEMIKRGEVPEGYKKTKIGIIPKEWANKKAEEIGNVIGGGTPDTKNAAYWEGDIPWISSADLSNNDYFDVNITRYINREAIKNSATKICNKDSILIVSRVGVGKIALAPSEICTSQDFTNITNVKGNVYFIICAIKAEIDKQLSKVQGTSIKGITVDEIKKLYIPWANIEEQKKISIILKKADETIELFKKNIIEKQKQKKWLMQNLLTGKKRVRGYKNDWKKIKIKKFIKEINEKTTKNNQYEILSVTKDGIFKQCEHFNKQIASEDNCGYKVIRKKNLVFSTMNLWMGSLDVMKKYDVGIVSPAYKTFEFDNEYMVSEFGEYFMKSNYMVWIYGMNSEQGASVVRKNLNLDGLLNTFVSVPDIKEQKAIAKILFQADKEIELLQQKLEQIKLEKKAMMQLLLTGIVRVN